MKSSGEDVEDVPSFPSVMAPLARWTFAILSNIDKNVCWLNSPSGGNVIVHVNEDEVEVSEDGERISISSNSSSISPSK